MAAGNDDDEGGGGGDGDPELCTPEAYTGPGGRRSLEKALEEAAATGVLNLSGRRMKELPGSARNSDLTDVTRADLSRNRLSELPVELSHLVSLESLTLYHNCLRTLPPSFSNLQVLSYLNISRNLLTSLPPHICHLPLTVLIASNNKLASIPEEVGGMSSLRQLDVSCNELQALPAQLGALRSLRELNVRRNQLSSLPEELSELPLTRLDFSCNRVARIPPCYHRLRHLQSIVLDNNPLQYPPAQICLKGKVHIFKYLYMEACGKAAPELEKLSRPTSFTTCLTDDLFSHPYGGLDSGFNSVDSGSKRWSGNESADELSDLSFRVSGLGREVRQLKEKLNGAANGENESPDFIDSSTNDEEEGTKGDTGLQATPQEQRKPERHSTPRPEERTLLCTPEPSPPSTRQDQATEERRRPETLLIWKERERQQLQQRQDVLRRPSVDRRESLQKTLSCTSSAPQSHSEVTNSAPGVSSEGGGRLRSQGSQTELLKPLSPSETSAASVQKPNSFLFRSCSRGAVWSAAGSEPSSASSSPVRLRSPHPRTDEKTVLAQVRKDMETLLNITLEDPLCETLSNGVTLCQLLNHLRPRTIPIINVPSPAVPKLNLVKCRRNVDNFLDACRRLGVPEMSSYEYMDYDSPEDNEEDESDPSGDFSSADDPIDAPHHPLPQCDTSVLRHSHSVSPPPWPLTSRVLFHPSFEAFYTAVAVHQNLETPEMRLRLEEGFTANPGEYFYTDPLLPPGHRVYNCLSPAGHNMFGCFRLQAPPPIMASCVFPSAAGDDVCDGEVCGERVAVGEVMAGRSEDMVTPQCVPSPVLGSSLPPTVPSPVLYSLSELQAASALLWLSSPPPAQTTS